MIPKVPEWIYDQGFSPAERDVYLYCWMRTTCFDDKRKMAKRLGMGINKLWTALNRLEEHGWLRKHKAGKSTCYIPQTEGQFMIKVIKNVSLPKDTKPENVSLPRDGNYTVINSTSTGGEQGTSMTGKPLHCSQEDYDSLVGCIWEAGRARRVTR